MEQAFIKTFKANLHLGTCYKCGKELVTEEEAVRLGNTKTEVVMHLSCAVRKLLAGGWAQGAE